MSEQTSTAVSIILRCQGNSVYPHQRVLVLQVATERLKVWLPSKRKQDVRLCEEWDGE